MFASRYAHDWNKRNAVSIWEACCFAFVWCACVLLCFFFLAGLIVSCLILNKFLFQQKIWHVIFPVIGVYQSTFLAVIN